MKFNLLTVDDDVINNIIVRKIAAGFREINAVIDFTSASVFLDYLERIKQTESQPPAVILIDINMPVMNGWQLLGVLEKNYQALLCNSQICILSSSNADVDVLKAKNHAMVDRYFQKPFTDAALEDLLKVLA